ncbi:MAG TPA: hypothetical protein VF306_21130, partial [Pirellulales bacterium]
RMAEREDRLWMVHESAPVACESPRGAGAAPRASDVENVDDGINAVERSPEAIAAGQRFAHLPAGLCDLAHLARGRRSGKESVSCTERSDTESVADRELPQPAGEIENSRTPVSTLFERRCAEAFRCLGFEVRELGQGRGRTADCLAVAAAERFAVIIDAKARREGYTLGTDDRQFCEYARRHCRELAQSGVERVYFAVIGHGFRQTDLDKLAGLMTGTPIRSVVFIEAEALMALVDQSIRRRREFRLAEIDRLLVRFRGIGKPLPRPPTVSPLQTRSYPRTFRPISWTLRIGQSAK